MDGPKSDWSNRKLGPAMTENRRYWQRRSEVGVLHELTFTEWQISLNWSAMNKQADVTKTVLLEICVWGHPFFRSVSGVTNSDK